MKILESIIVNVLTSLYQPFGFAVLLSVLFMFLYIFAEEHGWKKLMQRWLEAFKTNKNFPRILLLTFYTSMILLRTLLNRRLWENALSDVIGVWGIYDAKGELTTEAIENLALFIPFSVLLLWSFREKILGEAVKLFQTSWQSVKIVFLFSLTIEFLQLFLRLGTFQLSDLFYNTLGGFVGGLIYWSGYELRNKFSKGSGA